VGRNREKIRTFFRVIRKPLLFAAGTIVFIIVSCSILAFVYEEEVEQYFLGKLNKQLNTKVEIGELSFSLLRHFPDASITLENVKAHHSKPYVGAGNLLVAEHIVFRFNLFDLFGDSYSVNGIDLENGAINILRNEDKTVNYQLLKKDNNPGSDKFQFSLNALHFKNINILIRDEPSSFSTTFLAVEGHLKGNFSETEYELNVQSDLQVSELVQDKTKWLSSRPVTIDAGMLINTKTDLYSFKKGNIKISNLDMSVTGSYRDSDVPFYDLIFKGQQLNISSFLSLLPSGYDEKIKEYESDGEFYADAMLKGEWGETVRPDFKVSFGVKNAEITQKKSKISLHNVNLTGNYSAGKNGNLSLKNVNVQLKNGSLKGSCTIRQFNDPVINLNAVAKLDLSEVDKFLALSSIHSMQGRAEMNIRINGSVNKIATFSAGSFQELRANGDLTIKDASFRLPNDTLNYSGFNGSLRFTNNDVVVEQFKGLAGKSDFFIQGRLSNVFAFVLSENKPLRIDASVSSNLVNLDELFKRKTHQGSDSTYGFKISPRISLAIDARVRSLKFRRFSASEIVGNFSVNNKMLMANRLSFNTMDGKIDMNGSVDGTQPGKLLLSCNTELKKVDIRRLFYECENFGQDVMQDKNLKGKMDADVVFTAISTETLDIDADKIYTRAGLVIHEGELINFEALNALSKFISLDELKHVRFSTLKNQIEIRNRKIIIPQMDIASSAITISASGTHTFDNVIDYHLRLLLSDILSRKAKKAKKENEEFGEIADDGLGKTNLFISMTGNVENPIIAYDTRGAKQKMQEDLVSQKKDMKQVLHDEFGWYRKDSTVVKKQAGTQKKKEPKVIVEFED